MKIVAEAYFCLSWMDLTEKQHLQGTHEYFIPTKFHEIHQAVFGKKSKM